MLVGQTLSESEMPIYGCYVIGQNWHFVTLIGKNYCTSPADSALTNEIALIFRTLLGLKIIVEKRTSN
jgi:hypothetical protein